MSTKSLFQQLVDKGQDYKKFTILNYKMWVQSSSFPGAYVYMCISGPFLARGREGPGDGANVANTYCSC